MEMKSFLSYILPQIRNERKCDAREVGPLDVVRLSHNLPKFFNFLFTILRYLDTIFEQFLQRGPQQMSLE